MDAKIWKNNPLWRSSLNFLCIILMTKSLLNGSYHFSLAFFVLVFVFVILTCASSSYASLYEVVEKLPAPFVVGFNSLRTRVIVTDEKARLFMISHHDRQLEDYPTPARPEYYQVWTSLRMSSPDVVRNLSNRREFLWTFLSPSVPSMLFDGWLKEVISRRGREMKPISSLRAVGFVRERGKPILLAILARNADSAQMVRTLELLGALAHDWDLRNW